MSDGGTWTAGQLVFGLVLLALPTLVALGLAGLKRWRKR